MDFLHIHIHDQEMKIMNIYSTNEFEERFGDEEDDVFYEELKRQVLKLTTEDDEDRDMDPNMFKARKQGTTKGPYSISKPGSYYDWPGITEDSVAPAWILKLWRSGNGTGVFIPQFVQSRRRNKPRRKKSVGERIYKKVEKMN